MTINTGEGDTKERFSPFFPSWKEKRRKWKKRKKEESECGDGIYE